MCLAKRICSTHFPKTRLLRQGIGLGVEGIGDGRRWGAINSTPVLNQRRSA